MLKQSAPIADRNVVEYTITIHNTITTTNPIQSAHRHATRSDAPTRNTQHANYAKGHNHEKQKNQTTKALNAQCASAAETGRRDARRHWTSDRDDRHRRAALTRG
eukprot:scaffold5059_cov120-Isochrysis_galbana.AAC.1